MQIEIKNELTRSMIPSATLYCSLVKASARTSPENSGLSVRGNWILGAVGLTVVVVVGGLVVGVVTVNKRSFQLVSNF